MVMSKRPPLDEWLSLFQATVAAEGVTTFAGAAAGTSIIDAGLIGAGANSFVSMLLILYPGQPRLVDSHDITAFNNINGEVTYSAAYKGVAAAIPAGVAYKIVTFRIVDTRVMGRSQVAATTIDLFQAAGPWDLFTGTAQAVILESLNIKLPTGAIGGTITGITIQTDDATPGVIIDAATGAVANLLTEADLGWTGTLYITVATKIRLTIITGPAGAEYICNVTAKYKAVVSGGYLA